MIVSEQRGLVLELQREASGSSVSTTVLLRKASVVAAKLGLPKAREWIQRELNGYQNGDPLPLYRYIRAKLVAHHPWYGRHPVEFEDSAERRQVSQVCLCQAIDELEELAQATDTLQADPPAHLTHMLTLEVPIRYHFKPLDVRSVINRIRQKVLDWSLELETGTPSEGAASTVTEPVDGGAPIRVLFLAASPYGPRDLQLTNEARAIEHKLRSSEYRDALQFICKWAVRPEDLQEALLHHRPHIVHFSGHGKSEGFLLEGDDGEARCVPAAALAQMFQTHKDQIRLVIFNACFSVKQAAAITEHIDFVIGMHAAIGDDAATVFSKSFYMAMGYGSSIGRAFETGKNGLALHNLPAKEQPILLQRSGANAASTVFVHQRHRTQVSLSINPKLQEAR